MFLIGSALEVDGRPLTTNAWTAAFTLPEGRSAITEADIRDILVLADLPPESPITGATRTTTRVPGALGLNLAQAAREYQTRRDMRTLDGIRLFGTSTPLCRTLFNQVSALATTASCDARPGARDSAAPFVGVSMLGAMLAGQCPYQDWAVEQLMAVRDPAEHADVLDTMLPVQCGVESGWRALFTAMGHLGLKMPCDHIDFGTWAACYMGGMSRAIVARRGLLLDATDAGRAVQELIRTESTERVQAGPSGAAVAALLGHLGPPPGGPAAGLRVAYYLMFMRLIGLSNMGCEYDNAIFMAPLGGLLQRLAGSLTIGQTRINAAVRILQGAEVDMLESMAITLPDQDTLDEDDLLQVISDLEQTGQVDGSTAALACEALDGMAQAQQGLGDPEAPAALTPAPPADKDRAAARASAILSITQVCDFLLGGCAPEVITLTANRDNYLKVKAELDAVGHACRAMPFPGLSEMYALFFAELQSRNPNGWSHPCNLRKLESITRPSTTKPPTHAFTFPAHEPGFMGVDGITSKWSKWIAFSLWLAYVHPEGRFRCEETGGMHTAVLKPWWGGPDVRAQTKIAVRDGFLHGSWVANMHPPKVYIKQQQNRLKGMPNPDSNPECMPFTSAVLIVMAMLDALVAFHKPLAALADALGSTTSA